MTPPTDLLLANGSIWTGRRTVGSVGIADGRVVAAGDVEEARSTLRPGYATIDLGGRRAIPGLIDSHVHVMRAGLTWNHLVRWDDVRSLDEGLGRIRQAASRQPAGSWIRVLGGWHPGRFEQRRGPTRAELDEAGGDHPVYVQLLYEEGVLNSAGLQSLLEQGDVPGIDRDDLGRPTGRVTGPLAFTAVASMFERPTRADRMASTSSLMADFASLGVTAAIDPGGFGVSPESYEALFGLWRGGDMTMRVRLYLVPATRGEELSDVRAWVRYVQPGFGDDMLRYVGMGEILSFDCHDMEGVRPFQVSTEAKADLLEISDVLAGAGWPIHLHAIFDSTIEAVLDVWEEVDRRHGLAGRRFSLAHAEPIGRRNLERVRDLGVGLAIQNRLMFRSKDSAASWGDEVARNSPPLADILAMGIPLGAGTDATVVSPHDPWQAIWWLVTGESVDGAPPRDARHRLTVEQALSAYTRGSAWFSFDEADQGHLEPGARADVAVLDADPFAVAAPELRQIRSDLTLVGGNPVHTGPPFT